MNSTGKIKKPPNWRIEAIKPKTKNCFCLLNTKGIVDNGDKMKFNINHGAIISDNLPDKYHSSPNTNENISPPKK